jgi:hypothetical protein
VGERVDLEVPFAEKDEAKALGARWDPASRTWYLPAGLDPAPFRRWLPGVKEEGETELLPPVYSVESKSECWRCGRVSSVATVAAESFVARHDSGDGASPELLGEPVELDLYVFSGIEYLPEELVEEVRKVNSGYRRRFSKNAGASYYMNHCASCGAQLGDFYMHSEPGGAFFPTAPRAARAIRLRRLAVPGRPMITGSPSMVSPNLILKYAERVDS